MNIIINGKPSFEGEHFVYGQPSWLDPAYRGAALVAAIALMGFAATSTGQGGTATQVLFLVAAVLGLAAFSPRSELASIYFICDHRGVYFPSDEAQRSFANKQSVRWLLVPWSNILDIHNQLVLDEAANKQGIALSVIASAEERHEFLSRFAISRHLIGRHNQSQEICHIGFASQFHDADDAVAFLNRLRRPTTLVAA